MGLYHFIHNISLNDELREKFIELHKLIFEKSVTKEFFNECIGSQPINS